MGDYLQSIIYKLSSPSHPEVNPYYGSSKNPAYKRRGSHKGDYKAGKNSSAFLILCYDDWVLEVVEEYPCESANQLRLREGWWISNHPCVNQRNAGTGKTAKCSAEYFKQYYTENKERLKEKAKQHYEENKEQHKMKSKEYQEANREHLNAKRREWVANNREAVLLKKREAYKRRTQKPTA